MPGFQEGTPNHDRLPIPEGLDEETIMFVLEMMGNIAINYGVEAMQLPSIQPESPDSIVDFAAALRSRIEVSDEREAAEKETAIRVLDNIVDQLREVLTHIQNS
jgi:hypothetical protein